MLLSIDAGLGNIFFNANNRIAKEKCIMGSVVSLPPLLLS